MTDQDPYSRPRPGRVSRHAAPARWLSPPYQRMLRLLVVAGTGAAGLCLVISGVALVAAAGGPPHGATVTPTAHQSAAHGSGRANPAATSGHGDDQRAGRGSDRRAEPPPVRPETLLRLAGRGSQVTRRFLVGGAGTWRLSWTYHGCRGPASRASFRVTEGSLTGASLAQSGPAGHGISWAYANPGWHHLIIRSHCAWRIAVTGPS